MSSPESTDPFNLYRFVFAQEDFFETALYELKRGRKESHWMWFVFPQMAGLGRSSMAQRYGIRNLEEARAYLAHPVLGPRLLDCCRALLAVKGRSASQIMGDPDDVKLRSSMTLFVLASDSQSEFREVLERYFLLQLDQRTLELLHLRP